MIFALLLFVAQMPSLPDMTGVERQVAAKIELLQREVARHPGSAAAWGKLAMNLHAHDFLHESLPYYDEARKKEPGNFHWIYYEGVALQELNSTEAVDVFKESLRLKPNYAPAHLRLAQSLFAAGRMGEAATEFRETLKHDPRSADAFVGLARLRLASNSLEEARQLLLDALLANQDHAEAHGLLSEVYRRMNRPDDANRELVLSERLPRKVPPPDPELKEFLMEGVSSYWYDLRGRALLQQGQYQSAIEQLKKAVEILPDARFFDTLGIAYQYQKKFSEAVEQHKKALALKPDSAGTLNNLAAAYHAMGKKSEAEEALQRAIVAEPDFAYSYSHLARMLSEGGKRSEAISVLRKGNQVLPENKQICLQLAWLLSVTANLPGEASSEAVGLARSICGSPENADSECLDVLSAAYASTGDYANAISTAERASKFAAADQKKRIESRITMYRKGKPYRE